MITPRFSLEQDEEFVVVSMRVPGHVRLGEDDVWMEGREFKFHAHPYFLALAMPGEVVQDGRERAEFDRERDTLRVWVPKLNRGERFEDLDLLTTTLQQGQGQVQSQAQTEGPRVRYGFNEERSGFFEPLQDDLVEIVDLPDPDSTRPEDRTTLREAQEDARFDPDHFVADSLEPTRELSECLAFDPPWRKEAEALRGRIEEASKSGGPESMVALTPATVVSLSMPQEHSAVRQDVVKFSEDHEAAMMSLPKREYSEVRSQDSSSLAWVIDVLLSFAYDHRTTMGEPTVESPWTICKLSRTLSWLDPPRTLREALVSFFRRSLCFPLYRTWELSMKIASRDLADILFLGKRGVLRAVLDTRAILVRHETRHYLNALFLDDLASWVQRLPERLFLELRSDLLSALSSLDRSVVCWPLDALLEQYQQEQPEGEDQR